MPPELATTGEPTAAALQALRGAVLATRYNSWRYVAVRCWHAKPVVMTVTCCDRCSSCIECALLSNGDCFGGTIVSASHGATAPAAMRHDVGFACLHGSPVLQSLSLADLAGLSGGWMPSYQLQCNTIDTDRTGKQIFAAAGHLRQRPQRHRPFRCHCRSTGQAISKDIKGRQKCAWC